MSQSSSPEIQLLNLIKQRDAVTSEINALLQRIVGASSLQLITAPPAAAKRRGRPTSKKSGTSKGARGPGRPAGSSNKNNVSSTTSAPVEKRGPGRPVGWRKDASAESAPSGAKRGPGRPVGWRKDSSTKSSAPAPTRKGKAGRPKGAKNKKK